MNLFGNRREVKPLITEAPMIRRSDNTSDVNCDPEWLEWRALTSYDEDNE